MRLKCWVVTWMPLDIIVALPTLNQIPPYITPSLLQNPGKWFPGLRSAVPEPLLILQPHGSPGKNSLQAEWLTHCNFTAQHTNLVPLVLRGNGLMVVGLKTNISIFDLLATNTSKKDRQFTMSEQTNKQLLATKYICGIEKSTLYFTRENQPWKIKIFFLFVKLQQVDGGGSANVTRNLQLDKRNGYSNFMFAIQWNQLSTGQLPNVAPTSLSTPPSGQKRYTSNPSAICNCIKIHGNKVREYKKVQSAKPPSLGAKKMNPAHICSHHSAVNPVWTRSLLTGLNSLVKPSPHHLPAETDETR